MDRGRAPNAAEEAFAPYRAGSRERTPQTTHFRSTWVASSLRSLRDRGHYERYVAFLAPEARSAIEGSVAGTWLPVSLAVEHYAACARLDLPSHEVYALGQEVQHRVNATVLGTVVRLSKGAGVTPWVLFEHFHRLWDRVWMGGDIAVWKRGPKDARVEMAGCVLCAQPYFRLGFRGVIAGLSQLFCTKVYVQEDARAATATSATWRVSWA